MISITARRQSPEGGGGAAASQRFGNPSTIFHYLGMGRWLEFQHPCI